ncbi:MAG: PEP-CTERM sorting domain-containing protein [Phycisphaerales bacterium]|nr:PEP-CTERM sorting domain-containing protein [Phycisphaerales bacterium]
MDAAIVGQAGANRVDGAEPVSLNTASDVAASQEKKKDDGDAKPGVFKRLARNAALGSAFLGGAGAVVGTEKADATVVPYNLSFEESKNWGMTISTVGRDVGAMVYIDEASGTTKFASAIRLSDSSGGIREFGDVPAPGGLVTLAGYGATLRPSGTLNPLDGFPYAAPGRAGILDDDGIDPNPAIYMDTEIWDVNTDGGAWHGNSGGLVRDITGKPVALMAGINGTGIGNYTSSVRLQPLISDINNFAALHPGAEIWATAAHVWELGPLENIRLGDFYNPSETLTVLDSWVHPSWTLGNPDWVHPNETDIALVAVSVPEPAAVLSLSVLGAGLLLKRRKRVWG